MEGVFEMNQVALVTSNWHRDAQVSVMGGSECSAIWVGLLLSNKGLVLITIRTGPDERQIPHLRTEIRRSYPIRGRSMCNPARRTWKMGEEWTAPEMDELFHRGTKRGFRRARLQA